MSESGARSFTRGVLWVAVSQAVRLGSQIVGIAIFARFLPAEDFGVLALAALFTGFALLFRDLGTGAAVIQKKDLTAGLLDAVFWLNVFFGAGLALRMRH